MRSFSLLAYSSREPQPILTGAVPGRCTEAAWMRFSLGSSPVKISVISGEDR